MVVTQGDHSAAAPAPHPAAPTATEWPRAAGAALAALRIGIGFVFLWAFLDKTFGLGYATPAAKAWIHGGSPTKGFLGAVDVGPLQTMFHAWAGTWWADWLFMLTMLGVGAAVMLGVALRPAAAAGTLVLALMWFAEFPLAQTTAAGTPSGSTNPLVDYHVIYALALIVIAAAGAGHHWGLAAWWARLPWIRTQHWAR